MFGRRNAPGGTAGPDAASRPRVVAYMHDNVAFGGIETLQLEILRHLDPTRYAAVVIVAQYDLSGDQRFRDRLTDANVPLLAPASTTRRRVIGPAMRVWQLSRLLRRHGTDVVHIQTRTPQSSRRLTLAAFIARVPAIIRTEHVSPGPHVNRWTRLVVAPFDWITDLVITDSKADRRQQIELVGRKPSKVVSSYCGIDPFAFDPHHDLADAKRKLGIDPDVTVIGTVGRMHEQKGPSYLVSAAIDVATTTDRPLHFLLVGDGPELESLQTRVREAGLDHLFTFAGFQSNAVPYMEAMDIAVMPSLWEGFSISMQEFMALGKPLVASDHHSFLEAIDDGVHGLITPMRDTKAIADAVRRLLKDPAERVALGAAAAARARQEFSIQRHVAELMDHYDAALAARRHGKG